MHWPCAFPWHTSRWRPKRAGQLWGYLVTWIPWSVSGPFAAIQISCFESPINLKLSWTANHHVPLVAWERSRWANAVDGAMLELFQGFDLPIFDRHRVPEASTNQEAVHFGSSCAEIHEDAAVPLPWSETRRSGVQRAHRQDRGVTRRHREHNSRCFLSSVLAILSSVMTE